jgi:hypothetical protein
MSTPTLGSMTEFNSVRNTVTQETSSFDANLFHLSIPGTNPDQTNGILPGSISLPFFPKKRILLVNGTYQGTETQIRSFITEIENQTSSDNQQPRPYTNGVAKSYPAVRINSFSYNLSFGDVNRVEYTIELFTEAS